jgi:hypothetical protein
VLLAWALLLAAWAMGNAPFAAPDEADHYVRAFGISEGRLIGTADPNARVGTTAVQIAWTAQAARLVLLPTGFDPQTLACEPVDGSAGCTNVVAPSSDPQSPPAAALTTVGNYQPLPYLVPAALLRAGSSASGALRLARLAQALVVLALLAVAVLALRDLASPLVSLLGPLLAVTPMALFCGASLGGSGTEVAAAVAFLACLLRLCRPRATATARWWTGAALSGATLTLSRAASPLWLALAMLVVLAWSGRRSRLVTALRSRRPAAYVTAGVLALAVALNRIWEAIYGSRIAIDVSNLQAGLSAGVRGWWKALPDLVGKFGYLDVKLPLIVPLAWFVPVLLLATAAFAVSTPRERLVIALMYAGGLFGPAVFYALLIRPTGFGLQGRHVLPALVALPMLAGETLNRHRDRIHAAQLHQLARAVPVAVATMQAIAWYVNARRYAVGASGPTWFPGHATWAPPGSWSPWPSPRCSPASACAPWPSRALSRPQQSRPDRKLPARRRLQHVLCACQFRQLTEHRCRRG